MPMYQTVLVLMDRWRREPIEFFRRWPDECGTEIVDSEGATRELYRLMAPYDPETRLLYWREGLKIRVQNHTRKFQGWSVHYRWYLLYEWESKWPPPKFKVHERNPQPDDPTGFLEIANLPTEPFFGAAILPSGHWIPTPEDAGPEYVAHLMNRYHECLAVVVEVRL